MTGRSAAAAFASLATMLAGSACFDFSAYPFGEEGRYCWNDHSCDAGLFCDGNKICVNPCKGVDCSGHGTCVVNASDGANCVCDNGFLVSEHTFCVEGAGQLGYPCNNEGTCAESLSCRDNVCYSDACTPVANFSQHCIDGNLAWYDSCGARGAIAHHCGGNGCSADACLDPVWTELRLSASEPDVSEQDTGIIHIALTMDGPDQIYLAWTGARGDSPTQVYGTGVFVRKWSVATGWLYLGPRVSDTAYTDFKFYTEVNLLATNGAVLRATRANDADNGLHTVIGVDRWTGAVWEHELFRTTEDTFQVPFDPQTTSMSGSAPWLAGNQAGKVILVWSEWDQDFDSNANFEALYVARRSNVAGWSSYSNGSTSGSGAVGFQETRSHPVKAIVAASGDVYLIWNAYIGGRRTIQFRRDVAGAWLAPNGSSGQIATANEDDGFVSSAADSLGRIYLAWTHESDSGTHQFVARLDPDGTVNEVGSGSASSSGVSGSILKTDASRVVLDANEFPIVVWREEGRPHAKRWDGFEWRNYGHGGAADVLGDQLPPGAVVNALEIATAGNRLCLAWGRVLSTPETPPGVRVSCTTPQL